MNNHSARTRGKANGGRRASGGKKKEAAPTAPEGKRERILDAAIKVFAAEGFYNAKVSQIAQQAGVADGTIYLYFKSKDDLLITLFEDRMERVNANLRDAIDTETSAVARLSASCKLHLELVEQNRDMAEVITVELRQSSKFISEYSNPKFAEFLRTIAGAVVEGQRTGELRTGIDPTCSRARCSARSTKLRWHGLSNIPEARLVSSSRAPPSSWEICSFDGLAAR